MSGFFAKRGRKFRFTKSLFESIGMKLNLSWREYIKLTDVSIYKRDKNLKKQIVLVRRFGQYSHKVIATYDLANRNGALSRRVEILNFNTILRVPSQMQLENALQAQLGGSFVAGSNLQFDIESTVAFNRRSDLRNFPLFASNMCYPILGTQAESFEEKNGLCAYTICNKYLNLTFEEIEAHFKTTKNKGLTTIQILELFTNANKKVVLVDLNNLVLGRTLEGVKQDDQLVFIVGNSHIYEVDSEGRRYILSTIDNTKISKTGDMDVASHQEPEDEETSKTETVEVGIETFEQSLEYAINNKFQDIVGTKRDLMKSLCEEYEENEISATANNEIQITKLLAIAEGILSTKSRKSTEYKKARMLIKDTKLQHKQDFKDRKKAKIASQKDIKNTKLRTVKSNRKNIIINVCSTNLYQNYIKLLESGISYPSDISGGTITKILYQKTKEGSITIKANPLYKFIHQAANELSLKYNHQSMATLAWNLFEQMNASWQKSNYNKQVREFINTYEIMSPLNWSIDSELTETEEFRGIDFYRNYPSIALKGDFYTVDVLNEIEPYTHTSDYDDDEDFDFDNINFDNIEEGEEADFSDYIYYVETKDTTLFDGIGIYDYQIVEYAIDNDIISHSNIKYMIKINKSPSNDSIIKQYINTIYKKVSDDATRKQLVNFFIGRLGSKNGKSETKQVITTSLPEAQYHNSTIPYKSTISQIASMGGDKTKPIYLVNAKSSSMALSTNRLINMAIVQRGRLEVYKLSKTLDFSIVAIKTDCVVYKSEKSAQHITVPDNPTFGNIRREIIDTKYFKKSDRIDLDTNNFKNKKKKYKMKYAKFNEVRANPDNYYDYNDLLQYDRAFISGFAGSGKSYIIKKLASHFKELLGNNKVQVCSYTNKSAIVVDGKTLHSILGISTNGDMYEGALKKFLENIKVLIIDEVSMIPISIFRIISQLQSDIRIFGFGDMRQLRAPCETAKSDKELDDTSMFISLFDCNKITLTKQCRAEKEYANECLNFYETGEIPQSLKYSKNIPDINICYTNKMRQYINSIKIDKYKTDTSKIEDIDRYVRPRITAPNTIMTMIEKFDADKLAYIVNNSELYPQIINAHTMDANHDVFLQPLKYLKESHNGEKVVDYKYSAGSKDGRLYSDQSLSLQNMTRQIRHTVARDYYDDVDMENAHPKILQDICDKNNIETPELDNYVKNRNDIIKTLGKEYNVGKGPIKITYLSLMNGGRKAYVELCGKNGHPMIAKFEEEMKMIHDKLADINKIRYTKHKAKRIAKGKKNNHKASFCNILMCKRENEILMVMYKYLKSNKLVENDVVFAFDGIMIPKGSGISSKHIREMELLITDTFNGLDMKLVIKPMNEGVETPENLPKYIPSASVNSRFDEFPYIYPNMPVIANKNNHTIGYLNNQEFTIKSYDKITKKITLNCNDDELEIKLIDLQKDFRPSYCITIYKSQGSTINKKHMIHEFDLMLKYCDDKRNGQYVALTRTTDPKLLRISSL